MTQIPGPPQVETVSRGDARPDGRPPAEILDRRREIVEHPFGSIRQWTNRGAFLMKGCDNVRAEVSLNALVYNLRRAFNILGVEAMMGGGPGLKGDAILAPLNHAADARVIMTVIRRQNREKVAETSPGEVSPLNRSRFHTVWKIFAAGRKLTTRACGVCHAAQCSQNSSSFGLAQAVPNSPVQTASASSSVLA